MSDELDVIILGGGCAGLALARELSLRTHKLRVLVIEPRKDYSEDRTWCFWMPGSDGLRPASRMQWAQWRLSSDGASITHHPQLWRYHMVSAADYYADALAAIGNSDTVTLRLGTGAGAVTADNGFYRVETTAGPVRGRFIIDTRPPSLARIKAAPLAQLFSGLEVKVDHDVFDPQTATLMGDMTAEGGRLSFDYILPFSPRHALIERTVFTTSPEDPATLDGPCLAIVEALCGPGVSIVRQERGWLPMGLPDAPSADGAVIRAGLSVGALRPSSGYAFKRIQRWASVCADSLVSSGKPSVEFADPLALRVMDRVFLRAMTHSIGGAPGDFVRISRALNGDRFARFMSDEATWVDWLKVVLALPKTRYLAATVSIIQAWSQGRDDSC